MAGVRVALSTIYLSSLRVRRFPPLDHGVGKWGVVLITKVGGCAFLPVTTVVLISCLCYTIISELIRHCY